MDISTVSLLAPHCALCRSDSSSRTAKNGRPTLEEQSEGLERDGFWAREPERLGIFQFSVGAGGMRQGWLDSRAAGKMTAEVA